MASFLRTDRHSTPPSLADIEAIAEEAFNGLPDVLKRFASNVALHIEDFPDDETVEEMGLESAFDLMGLYRGVSLGEKSVTHMPTDVDHIFLYRRPLLDYWCETGEDLTRLVRHLMVHEIGHHFGFSDEDMEKIEESAG
jgi:predicted Zn-dependent protease with MMP-like domain